MRAYVVLTRFARDRHPLSCFVTDTHKDVDYTDAIHGATRNLRPALDTFLDGCRRLEMEPVGATLEQVCSLVLAQG